MLCCRGWRNRRIENRQPARCRNQRASSGAPRDGQDTGVGAQRTSLRKKQFHDVDLANCFLVVAATSSSKLHKRIFRLAKRRGVLCDVVDVRNSATSTTLPIYLIFTEGAPSVEFWIALKTYLKGAPCVTVCRSCPVARAPREFFARRKLKQGAQSRVIWMGERGCRRPTAWLTNQGS